MPESSRHPRVRALPPPTRLHPLARPWRGAEELLMPWWGAVLLVILAGAVAVTGWALFRLAARLGEMEARRSEPDQSMLLLQREVEAARNEAQKGLAETAATVRQELAQFSAQMTAQMGQVGASVQRELQHVGRVVGDVQGSLGKQIGRASCRERV